MTCCPSTFANYKHTSVWFFKEEPYFPQGSRGFYVVWLSEPVILSEELWNGSSSGRNRRFSARSPGTWGHQRALIFTWMFTNGSPHIWPRERESYISCVISLPLESYHKWRGHHLWNNKVSKEKEFAWLKLDPHLPLGSVFIPLNWICLIWGNWGSNISQSA